jgi:type I restriction enzyme M protein
VFDPDQIEFLANIVRLWRGEPIETEAGSSARIAEVFTEARYCDVPGLCRVASRAEVAAEDWSLNPGRYVGVAPGKHPGNEEFRDRLETLQEELEGLNVEAMRLQTQIAQNVARVLET